MFRKSVLIVVVAIVILAVYKHYEVQELPELEDKWWGVGHKRASSRDVVRTKISIPEQQVAKLKLRLEDATPFQNSLEGVHQNYGTHTKMLENVLSYWRNEYNWTERQIFLNQYPHYQVHIRGLKLHFLHVKPQSTVAEDGSQIEVLPLMLLHGWPGSIREFYEVMPRLTKPMKGRDFVFELVVPCLPGFGFSEASAKPGLSGVYMAQIFADLMEVLGFESYYLQGGDWGNNIVQHMAAFYPERIKGLHLNMCFVVTLLSNFKFFIGSYFPSLIYEADEVELCRSKANTLKFLIEETGYFHIQATKPDTVGVALRDSPMGLAAYILEKFSTLTNADYRDRDDGGITEKFSMEQLLDNIMIYWLTGSMTSAMRIYAEAFTNFDLEIKSFNGLKIHPPAGCARFRNEILMSPKSILTQRFKNLVHLTKYDRGGHFAALEEPQLFADDVYLFVETVRRGGK